MRNRIMFGLVAVSLAAMACGGEEKPAQDPSSVTTPPPAPAPIPESKPATTDPKPVETAAVDPTPAKPVEKPMTDAEIAAAVSAANNGEIEMAELAKKNATHGDVKSFAAMMITQHRDAENKAKAVATKAKITPAENDAATQLKKDVETTISTLKTQKGKEFDKAYIESQVKAHRDVLSMFDNKLLPNAQNGELKTHLTEVRGHVAAHLAKAEEIQHKLESAPASAPAGTKTPAAADAKKPAAPKK